MDSKSTGSWCPNGVGETKQMEPWIMITPPKLKMEPKNEGLEDVFPFQMGDFQVPC